MIKTIQFLIVSYCMSFNLSIAILLEEIRLIVLEKFEISYRHNSMKKTFDFRERPDFDFKIQLTQSWIKFFPLVVRLLILTLMKQIKPVVTRKQHFDIRYESFSDHLSGNFGLSRFRCKNQNQWFFNRILLYRSKASTCDFDWRSQTWSCWKSSIWTRRCINNDGIFQKFGLWGLLHLDTKSPIFQNSTLLQVKRFWLRPNWKKWALYSWRKKGCNIGISILFALLGVPSIWGSQNGLFQ